MSPDVLYARSKGAVVTIHTFDANKAPLTLGSGFVVAKDRIATNFHVIRGSSSAAVVFDDGTVAAANVMIAGSEQKDLAILEADTGSKQPLTLGDELSLKVGSNIYAIGAPQGLSLSLSNGLVSAFRQDEGNFLIQITASIDHGSSGGPLFDAQGRVVGITTSKLRDGSFGFAVGVGDLKRLLLVPLSVRTALADLKGEAPAEEANGGLSSIDSLMEEKRYAEAVDVLKNLPSALRDTFEAQLRLCEAETKLPEKSLAGCDGAIQIKPSSPAPYVLKALTLLQMHDLRQAEFNASRAMSLADDPDVKQLLGCVHFLQEKYHQAIKELSIDSSDLTALNMLGTAAVYTGDRPILDKVEQKLLDMKGADSPWVLLREGLTAKEELKLAVAQEKFERCSEDPDFYNTACAVNLAEVELTQGYWSNARKHIEAAVEKYYENSEVVSEAVYVLLVMGDKEAARQRHQLLGDGPYFNMASRDCVYYYALNRAVAAERFCEIALSTPSPSAEDLTSAGYVALDLGQYGKALKNFLQASQVIGASKLPFTVKDEIHLRWGLLAAGHMVGDKKDAKTLFSEIRRRDPRFLTLSGLKSLPLVWSDQTQAIMEKVLSVYR